MKKVLLLITGILLSLSLFACSNKEVDLYPFLEVSDNYAVYSFMNKDGEKVFDKEYDYILMNFVDGYSVVLNSNKISVIDEQGLVRLSGVDNVYEIKNDKAIAKQGDKVKLYDLKDNKELLSYDYIKMETEGIFPYLENGSWGYRDLTGEKNLPPEFDEAYNFGDKGSALAIKDGKTYLIDKEFNKEEIAYSDAIVIDGAPYVVASHDKHQSLLDLNGKVLIEEIPGDITEFKGELFVSYNRVDGVLKKEIYKIDGKRAYDEVFDEVRLLNKDFFAARENDLFALYSFKDGRITDFKYDFINADFYDKNGGIISANYDGKAVHLDKNGLETKAVYDNGAVSIIRDKNLNIIETNNSTLYVNDDGNVIKTSPKIGQTGVVRVVIRDDNDKPYPFIIHERLKPELNRAIKDMVDKLTDTKDLSYRYKLEGDILYITVVDGDKEYPFMLDIYEGRIIMASDILNSDASVQYLINEASKKVGLDGAQLICISYLDSMTMTIKSDNRTETVDLPYDLVEEYIDAKSGLFFKALLAPRINK